MKLKLTYKANSTKPMRSLSAAHQSKPKTIVSQSSNSILSNSNSDNKQSKKGVQRIAFKDDFETK